MEAEKPKALFWFHHPRVHRGDFCDRDDDQAGQRAAQLAFVSGLTRLEGVLTGAMRWIFLIALLVVSNVTSFYVAKKNARPKQHSIETVQTEVAHAAGIVIMGDSLVEDAKFPSSLCGLPIVNAGIGGAGVSTLLAIAEKMRSKPALIVISVGVNNAGDARFEAKYSLLLHTLPQTKIALVTLAQTGFDRINQTIRETATGAYLIDLSSLKDFKTKDGIHPIGSSYVEWRERILDGVRRALDCE